jgi:hypothetical protein
MDIADVITIQNDPQAPVTINEAYDLVGYLVINGYVAFAISVISKSFNRSGIISLFHESIQIGDLIFARGDEPTPFNMMNDLEFISFLTYGELLDYQSFNEYKFEKDYVLVKADFFFDYITHYKDTSTIWGGFVHENITAPPPARYKKTITSINLGYKLNTLDIYSYESSVRALEQPYAFERFLKLYHLLELQFDYFIIKKIQDFEIPRDSNLIGKTLNDYSRKELDRLTDIITHYITDIDAIENQLSKAIPFKIIAEEIFVKFGNSGHPLTDILKFNNVFSAGIISLPILERCKAATANNYSDFICKLSAYWIYRVRCSIAHNKIGEYLLSWRDENFIVEFAEPLLKEVLVQCFKK